MQCTPWSMAQEIPIGWMPAYHHRHILRIILRTRELNAPSAKVQIFSLLCNVTHFVV